MTRTNLVLIAVLAVVAGAWFMARDSEKDQTSGPALRLYPDFNKEAADRIVIEGGWKKQRYELGIKDGDWKLLSAGGYPAKKEEARKFIDAVYNLRRDARAGDSGAVQKESRTDDATGRLVTVYRGEKAMASFRLGKNPKSSWQEFFVRDANAGDVYRTRTLLTEELRSDPGAGDFGSGGFDWHNYTNSLYKWCDTKIWDLWEWDIVEIKLDREDLKATLVKKEENKWEVVPEGGEPAEADTDAINSISSPLKSLTFEEVVAPADASSLAEYGLDKDPLTVILTIRKKAEKKPDEEKKEDGEEGEGEEKKEEAPKNVTETRFLSVGSKVKVAKRFDEEKGEAIEEEFYAVLIGGDVEDGKQNFIYLVNNYKVAELRKTLEELKVEKEEEEKEGCAEEEGGCAEEDAEPEKEEEPEDEGEPEEPEEPEDGS